ncbi:MAG: alpha-amylase [Chloroflexi bacterium]|nr:alpha-amylase [Chloroflexota bacterium]
MLITRESRNKYKFPVGFFREDGHVSFPDLSSARAFAALMSARRDRPVPAADLYAMSLLDEAFHLLLEHYCRGRSGLIEKAGSTVQAELGDGYDSTLLQFVDQFPPNSIFLGRQTASNYQKEKFASGSMEEIAAIQDLLLTDSANYNPALHAYVELFDRSVMSGSEYAQFIERLVKFFSAVPAGEVASRSWTLYEILQAPVRISPNSIEGQLRFILENWGHVLGEAFTIRLLRGIDFIREEVIRRSGPAGFKSEAQVHTYTGQDYAEYERYSPDREWMPRLVLMAKNTYVWLDQLSRKYGREICTLDQIPDEELDLMAARGFTGLWLIGLWERSRASQRIKQRMGQQEAVASAYSLASYDIASDLGGWEALQNFRTRAWGRGIRLSADMVPNHMGIDSNWMIEHPDWFLSLSHSPYPSYSFGSENLADDPRVGIYLEDHYYDRTDAAVVFQRRDHYTGEVRYIYHGNDGTSFPWNDTAQLDYTRSEVREAVIQTILHVARNFPIIRFDAAMTLAKKHIQRLWFPEPGAGGAIPSRAQCGLLRTEFEAAIPNEFWREVVDRVASEIPDTLLLAEAFWLMEGYFVRTLGMHRVYNSAFMHMLRDEHNAKFRGAIRNTLEFDPQILKRYVNFMNNPDEKTAVEQYGTGDKYFGVATLLATLPGLPMFGHGQVEGFHEKYGMEYRRAKWEEGENEGLVRGHEWRIFPLLHRRYVFADVDNFLFYDFYTAGGKVNEDVFAYSNRHDNERGLILYHNRYAEARGWVRTSTAYLDRGSGELRQKSLAEGLDLPFEGLAIFRDYVTGLEYIRTCEDLWAKGMYVELRAYQSHVFMDWRFVDDGRWLEILRRLDGAGVPSIQAVWDELFSTREQEVVTTENGVSRQPRTHKASRRKKESVKKQTKKTGQNRKESSKPSHGSTRKKNPAREILGKSRGRMKKRGARKSPTKEKIVKRR